MKRRWFPYLNDVLRSPDDGGSGTGTGAGAGTGTGTGTGNGTGTGAGPGAGTGDGGRRPIAMSQDELDQLIEERLARDRRTRQQQGPTAEELAELNRLREEKRARDLRDQEAKGNYEAALASIREEAAAKEKSFKSEREQLLDEIRRDRCSTRLMAQLTTGASKAINPELCAKLLDDFVTLDESRQTIVVGEDKKPRFRSGRPVTIEELVEEFRAKNPWAFEAPNGGGEGAGARGGSNNGDGGADDLDVQIAAAQKEYDEIHAAAKASGNLTAVEKSREARRKLEELKSQKKARDKK